MHGFMSDRRNNYSDYKLIKHKEPIPVYLFTSRNSNVGKDKTKVSEIIDMEYYWVDVLIKLPRRSIGLQPIEMDLTPEQISDKMFTKHNIFDSEVKTTKYKYAYTNIQLLYAFANGSTLFGISSEPFELSDEMIELCENYKIKIIEE